MLAQWSKSQSPSLLGRPLCPSSPFHRVLLCPADHPNPLLLNLCQTLIRHSNPKKQIKWEIHNFGMHNFLKTGKLGSEQFYEEFDKCGIMLRGPLKKPNFPNFENSQKFPDFGKRTVFEERGNRFYCPERCLQDLFSLHTAVLPRTRVGKGGINACDITIIHDLVEGLSRGTGPEGGEIVHKSPLSVSTPRVITSQNCSRLTDLAVSLIGSVYNTNNSNKGSTNPLTLTAVHKANVLKKSDGLFLTAFQKSFENFEKSQNLKKSEIPTNPNFLKMETQLIDSLFAQLAQLSQSSNTKPLHYVCPQFYGELLDDICSSLVGMQGRALCSRILIGESHIIFSFDSDIDIDSNSDSDSNNPIGSVYACIALLVHLEEFGAAERISEGLERVLLEGEGEDYFGISEKEFVERLCAEIG